MPKPITVKNLKKHEECTCGFNSVEDYQDTVSIKDLKSLGYKKRVYKNSGDIFFFQYVFYPECNCNI